MTLNDTMHLALRNLRQAKLRTGLTMMGVSIGIASLAGMVSLGVGLQDQLVGQFLRSGVFDAITVTAPVTGGRGGLGRGGPFGARGGGGRLGGIGRRGGQTGSAAASEAPPAPTIKLDDEALKKLAALPDVKDVYPTISVPVEVTYEQFSEPFTATGVPMSLRGEGAFQTITYGAFFASDSDDGCLLSLDTAKRINDTDPKSLIGKNLTLGYAASRTPASASTPASDSGPVSVERVAANCPVVGIIEREPQAGPFGGRGVANLMIPLARARAIDAENVTSVQSLLGQARTAKTFTAVTVKVARPQATGDVEDQIKAMGFSAFSLSDALAGAKRAFIVLDIVLSLIGSIALAVSSLGIVNTMVMSILERTREIGIMKAIGASDADIRRIFLVEASAIGAMGGIAGIALGWLVGRAINFGANIYIQSQGGTPATLFSLPFWLIGGALGFSIVVSIVAGSYPAARAARLDPMQALRHD